MNEELLAEREKATLDALDQLFYAISQKKRMEFLGQFNEVALFIERAVRYVRDHESDKAK